ncbi:MAG: hypothetical protein IT371_07270 [Deltaproteobacteria bacterium]|nr:hypothetical protein [Deltaproteobacteria bacterium]
MQRLDGRSSLRRAGACFALATALVLSPRQAAAQVKPKVMILFDTSGSMLTDDDEDGSPLCGGRGKQSRLYQLKSALFDALQGLGTKEVDLSLATFPQMVDPSQTPDCPDGHYYLAPSQNSEMLFYGAPHEGCKVSTHRPYVDMSAHCGAANNPCSAWYTQYKSEALKVPFGQPVENLMWYFDQQEDSGTQGPLANPEIRAISYTPLGKSLFYAHGYFHREVALPAGDYRKKCERLVIALFTDGEETCNITTTDAYYPTTWAGNLHANLGVVTHTVAIDINSTILSNIASAGHGTYVTVIGNSTALKKAFLDIIAKSLPPSETCNGQDDDCDSQVDEDFPLKGRPCDNGRVGVCRRPGAYVCKGDGTGVTCNAPSVTGTAEVCNGLDDDCDGSIDEEIPGGCTACIPQAEVCNGIDDDCDGKVDEDVPSSPCGNTLGVCKGGATACVGGQIVCQGGQAGSPELCDGLDNDCDGTTDGMSEICFPFATGCDPKAGTCQGVCRLGVRSCTAGLWASCQGAVGPTAERCDGLDNDCDGQTDEQAECPGGSQCVNGQCTRACGLSEFACPKGQVCKNSWCIPDTCDAAACRERGGVCKAGDCVDLCASVTCNLYETCVKGQCVDHSCYAKGCPKGSRCVHGICTEDACAATSCGEGTYCVKGRCVALCEVLGCGPDQTCRLVEEAGSPVTRCTPDPCAKVFCGAGAVCREGRCVEDPCAATKCLSGELCRAGQCGPDPCETVRCPDRYRCKEGVCLTSERSHRELLATGAGGCTCQASPGGAGTPLSLLALLGLALARRRRRPRRP